MSKEFVDSFNEFSKQINNNNREKGFWDKPREDGTLFMLMVTELAEACEASRKGNPPDDKIPHFTGVEAELADTVIRIMDYAGALNLNLGQAIVDKVQYNTTRSKMHGGKKY